MITTTCPDADRIFSIIAEEVGVSRDELEEDTEFADLGVDPLLAKCILSRIMRETNLRLDATTFSDFATTDSLHCHLKGRLTPPVETAANNEPVFPSPKRSTPANPLSIILQGKLGTARNTIVLLPDGSGSGMSYMRLPRIDPDVCLIALNSSYLNAPPGQGFTIPDITATWAKEIRKLQPQGPYILGGSSAGGYYSFELAKHLTECGERVEKLIPIDSPCRLIYEEIPMEVVKYLSTNSLMVNWGSKAPPTWLVNHFDITIKAISEYVPTPIHPADVPDVCIVWAKEGVLMNADPIRTGLNFNVKVTSLLMLRNEGYGPLGWDRLFPGAKLSIATMPGNHFTMVHPPNVIRDSRYRTQVHDISCTLTEYRSQGGALSLLLRDSVQMRSVDRRGEWTEF